KIPGREDRIKLLAKTMKLHKEDGEDVENDLFELNERVNLPTHLGSQGVTQEHIEPLSELAVKDFCLPDNHRPAAKQDFIDLYSEAL
ncbi:MAG: iron-containing alcohol dehydrogenase, partial [Bacteroidetes bacterium]|nr:iron-containing alcohol dehydrogenase [Bacteroidota bacterium]